MPLNPMAAQVAVEQSIGIRLTITTEQVKQHCISRAEHHQGKARWYEAEATRLKGAADGAEDEDESFPSVGYSKAAAPVGNLRSSAKHHSARAAWFKAVATYVEPGQTFTLSLHDMDRFDLAEAFR